MEARYSYFLKKALTQRKGVDYVNLLVKETCVKNNGSGKVAGSTKKLSTVKRKKL